MCFLPDITHSSLKNARQLIEHLREMPERVLLIHFIYSGYGPRKGAVEINTFEGIIENSLLSRFNYDALRRQ
jgi:hypothetical protein